MEEAFLAVDDACSVASSFDNRSLDTPEWILAGLEQFRDPENIRDVQLLKQRQQEAINSLEFFKSQVPPSPQAHLAVKPLDPAEFNKQIGILETLGLEGDSSSYLNPGTDALSPLFMEENWRQLLKFVIYFNGDEIQTGSSRLVAILMSGWEAFVTLAINNKWGINVGSYGSYSPGSCLLKLDDLATRTIKLKWLELKEVKLLLSYDDKLSKAFPGLEKLCFVKAAKASYPEAFPPESPCVSSGRDSPVGPINFDPLSEAASLENGSELFDGSGSGPDVASITDISTEDLTRLSDTSDASSNSVGDSNCSYNSDRRSNGFGTSMKSNDDDFYSKDEGRAYYYAQYEYLDMLFEESKQKWKDIKRVLQVGNEIELKLENKIKLATKKPYKEQLMAHLAFLPEYSEELKDLEMWLARFKYAVDNRLYFKNWPQGDEDATDTLNALYGKRQPTVPLTEAQIVAENARKKAMAAKHFKALKFDRQFPAPEGVEEMARALGWDLEDALDSDDEVDRVVDHDHVGADGPQLIQEDPQLQVDDNAVESSMGSENVSIPLVPWSDSATDANTAVLFSAPAHAAASAVEAVVEIGASTTGNIASNAAAGRAGKSRFGFSYVSEDTICEESVMLEDSFAAAKAAPCQEASVEAVDNNDVLVATIVVEAAADSDAIENDTFYLPSNLYDGEEEEYVFEEKHPATEAALVMATPVEAAPAPAAAVAAMVGSITELESASNICILPEDLVGEGDNATESYSACAAEVGPSQVLLTVQTVASAVAIAASADADANNTEYFINIDCDLPVELSSENVLESTNAFVSSSTDLESALGPAVEAVSTTAAAAEAITETTDAMSTLTSNAAAIECASESVFLPNDLLVEEEDVVEEGFAAAEASVSCLAPVKAAPAAATEAAFIAGAELQLEGCLEDSLVKESINTATADTLIENLEIESAPAAAPVTSTEVIKTNTGTATADDYIYYYNGPWGKGNSLDECCSCSDFGADSSCSTSDYDSVELSEWTFEEKEEIEEQQKAEAGKEPTAGKKKKGIWRKAGRAIARKMRRGLMAVLPKRRLACFMMGAAPVLD